MRSKNERILGLKPQYLSFGPNGVKSNGTVLLDSDEFEALYLMDSLGLYQEESAARMGVSRPTFSRIVGSARKKVADALIHGKQLTIADEVTCYVIAFPSDDGERLSKHVILAKQFGLAQIDYGEVVGIEWIENPIARECDEKGLKFKNDHEAKGMAAGRIIPPLLERANILLVRSIGEGLRRNMEGTGKVVRLTKKTSITEVIETFIGEKQ